MQHTLSLWVLE